MEISTKAGEVREARIKDLEDDGWIRFRTIIEMLGAPKEHVEETLKQYLENIREMEGLVVISEDIAEPVPQESLFSTFAELELMTKSLQKLLDFCFDYMPASVEIVHPAVLQLEANDLTDFVNDLQSRLHRIDMEYKNTKALVELSELNMGKIIQNFIHVMLESRPWTLADFVHKTGIEEKLIKQVLDYMTSKGYIAFDNGVYKISAKAKLEKINQSAVQTMQD